MGRYLGPKEKISRRLGVNLGLKPERSFGPKSAFLRRPYPPGLHGKKRRRALSDYGLQLAEKQKVRFSYGISEKQLRKYFAEAKKSEGATGYKLFEILERRLDNVVYKLGFAPSRLAARQMVNHGHFIVNGRRVKTPSYLVKKSDKLSIRPNSKNSGLFKNISQVLKKHEVPAWLRLNQKELEAEVVGLPAPDEITMPFDMQLLIEFYSR
jgi:small subunit ribosomal protein S4